eukprot:3896519-Rhodomonas_salina.2
MSGLRVVSASAHWSALQSALARDGWLECRPSSCVCQLECRRVLACDLGQNPDEEEEDDDSNDVLVDCLQQPTNLGHARTCRSAG